LGFLGKRNSYSHAAARFDSFDETIHAERVVEAQLGGETCTYPKRVGRLDEHAVGTDVGGLGTQDSGSPFDLEAGTEGIARRSAALEQPLAVVPTSHERLDTPYLGFQAAAPGRQSRHVDTKILGFQPQLYDAASACFVPCIGRNATMRYYR
jgi:hypothetical protein